MGLGFILCARFRVVGFWDRGYFSVKVPMSPMEEFLFNVKDRCYICVRIEGTGEP